MEKKIIALALVLVLMVTAFVGCGKRETTKINGKDYVLYTDDEGNTVINDKNQVVAVVTEEDGDVVTFENGEDQTYFVQLYGPVVKDNVMSIDNYKLGIPEGWSTTTDGKVVKDGTDNKCYIKFVKVFEYDETTNLDTYLEKIDEQNEQLIPGFAKEGYTLTVEDKEAVITSNSYQSYKYTYKIVDKDNNVLHYAENYYFAVNNVAYSLTYACEEGKGYDASFNFENYVNIHFQFKAPVEDTTEESTTK